MAADRPTLGHGDLGSEVVLLQMCLDVRPLDGDFGSITEEAVRVFQRNHHLDIDGVVGDQTWKVLDDEHDLPLYPPELLPMLDERTLNKIQEIAARSEIATYHWKDRGAAPTGYTKGMAVAWSTLYRKWQARDFVGRQCAEANTHNPDYDALTWYDDIFRGKGMSNDHDGVDTLRHLFVLLFGLGMRESSGKHCEGRDMSASNVSAETCEAGLFQTSWNISGVTTDMLKLLDEYSQKDDPPQCGLEIFSEHVTCSSSSWSNYGSGTGADYQALAKKCPQFAVEMTALGLRLLRQHWGPINRKEVEVRPEADDMLREVQDVLTLVV
jgi:Putative peptidoglycan binding domain